MQKKQVVILLACLFLLVTGLSGTITTATAPNQSVFKTPEEAITAYLKAVVQGDMNKILETCAIDEMSKNFKFDLLVDWLGAFLPLQSLAPSDYPFYVEQNKAQVTAEISRQVRFLMYSLLTDDRVGDGMTVPMDIEAARSLMKAVDPAKLAGLEVKKIAFPSKTYMNDRYLKSAAKRAAVYGADEATERVVLFSFGQDYYYIGFTLLRYGENWKISSQSSALANTSATGVVQKTTVEDFETMINY